MELRFFDAGTIPEYSTREWHAGRDRAMHLEQPEHQPRLFKARDYVLEVAAKMLRCRVSDFGAGDGGLLSLIAGSDKVAECWGYDFTPANVAGALERGVTVDLADFVASPVQFGDVAVLTEVLEHMADPHEFLRRAHGNDVFALVASSPADETEHDRVGYHVWAWDMDGYAAMIEDAGFRIVRHERVGGFQVVLAVADWLHPYFRSS